MTRFPVLAQPIAICHPMSNFNRWHWLILSHLWVAFSGLTFAIVNAGLDVSSSNRSARLLLTTLATPLGPMTGAISRDYQPCCLNCSLSLLKYCGPILGIAVAMQFIPHRQRKTTSVGLLVVWTLGFLAWFGSGILSLLHALE